MIPHDRIVALATDQTLFGSIVRSDVRPHLDGLGKVEATLQRLEIKAARIVRPVATIL